MQCQIQWNDWIGEKTRRYCHYYQSIQQYCQDSKKKIIMLAFKQGYLLKKIRNTTILWDVKFNQIQRLL